MLTSAHRATARGLTGALCAAFLLTGAAALLFETLWFRLAGLALGNSIWASSAVLASFMAGLALGNGLAARFGERVARPLRLYAVLEIGVAATGLGLVLGFPLLADRLAPLLARWAGAEVVLHGARILVAFGLMLLPATAIGTTLPLLARALVRHDAGFGVALGRLYGWNTLGGVAGAVIGEGVLIAHLGLSRTAFVAVGLNITAAAIALGLDARWGPSVSIPTPDRPSSPTPARRRRCARLLGALFIADAPALASWCGDTPPLVDDRPGRLSQDHPPPEDLDAYRELMDPRRGAERFSSSPHVRRLWPAPLHEKTMPWFEWQRVFNDDFARWARPDALADLGDVLERTSLRALPLLLLDSEPRVRDIARARAAAGDRHPALSHHLGIAALADRDYEAAARHFAEAESREHPPGLLRALALGLGGRRDEALETLQGLEDLPLPAAAWRGWLGERLGHPDG